MRWIVDGADRQSGEERTVSVESENRAGAEEAAGRLGLLIGGVRAVEPGRLPPLEELASDPAGDNEALAVLANEWAQRPASLPVGAPVGAGTSTSAGAGNRRGLTVAAWMVRIFALLACGAAVVLGRDVNVQGDAPVREIVLALLPPLGCLACAAALYALGEIAVGVRGKRSG